MCPRRTSSGGGAPPEAGSVGASAGAGTSGSSAGAGMPGDLAGSLEDLYQLEPSQFTGARSALAAEARRAGARDLAQHIAKLARPSRAAFGLNLLVHRRPGEVERLLQLAASLRDASQRLAGSELRELGVTRQQLISQLTSAACELASERGSPLTASSVEEVEESLQAALLDEQAARAVTSGHLARPLRLASIGTGELDDSLPSIPSGRTPSPPEERPVKKPAHTGGAAKKRPAAQPSPGERAVAKSGPDGAPDGSARAERRREEQASRARLREADETARRAAAVAGDARKELEKARRAHERALKRRETAETALVSARRDEMATSRALAAAEGAVRRSEAALQAAERTRREARHPGAR
jgi:hypothetical protein